MWRYRARRWRGAFRRAWGWYRFHRRGRVGAGAELLLAALTPALYKQIPVQYRTPAALVAALLPLLLGNRLPRELRGISAASAAYAMQGLSNDFGMGSLFNDEGGGLKMQGLMAAFSGQALPPSGGLTPLGGFGPTGFGM